jgi:hypothetical protein
MIKRNCTCKLTSALTSLRLRNGLISITTGETHGKNSLDTLVLKGLNIHLIEPIYG